MRPLDCYNAEIIAYPPTFSRISKRRQRPAVKNPITVVDFFPFLCPEYLIRVNCCTLPSIFPVTILICKLFYYFFLQIHLSDCRVSRTRQDIKTSLPLFCLIDVSIVRCWKTDNFEDRKYSCVVNHDWWWQRHDEDSNDDELQMNRLHNFEDDFHCEYDDLQVNDFGKCMTRMMISIRWL